MGVTSRAYAPGRALLPDARAAPPPPPPPPPPLVLPAPPLLPPGWEAKLDTPSGRIFYVNHVLKAISWDRPTFPTEPRGGPPARVAGWSVRDSRRCKGRTGTVGKVVLKE